MRSCSASTRSRALPNVLFVTTTNFIEAVDDAFLSRADLVMHFELPDPPTIERILTHSLLELAAQWPELMPLSERKPEIAELAALCQGWNGRKLRKLVLAALAQRTAVARNPGELSFDDLRNAARKQGGVEWSGGAAPRAAELFPRSRVATGATTTIPSTAMGPVRGTRTRIRPRRRRSRSSSAEPRCSRRSAVA